ncbi:MAG: hypothetical protein JJE04_11885 [Acidobacteriia bacterium]|nr:hypothetical protein [Terriglobia bacterium]
MVYSQPEELSVPVSVDLHYLLQAPDPLPENPLLVLVTHGYGMQPSLMLGLARQVLPSQAIIASLEAPNQHYLSEKPGSDQIGFNWGTRARWRGAVSTHQQMLLSVIEQCRQKYRVPGKHTLLLGFSQPVGLNYRFAATCPDEIGGVIGICGGVPKDWEDEGYQPVSAALLHIARNQDEYYPVETVKTFAGRLRHRASDVEFHLLEGPHRFPSKAGAIVQPWLRRVFPKAAL